MTFQATVSVKGTKQGQFKGESTDPKQANLIPILDFQNQVSEPIDQATGAASGKRQHTPVVIVKQWGAASPQFFQALVTNEVLQTVAITFSRLNSVGIEESFFTIVLTNAAVREMRQFVGRAPGLTDDTNTLDQISMTYQRIVITDTIAKTSVTDDWLVS